MIKFFTRRGFSGTLFIEGRLISFFFIFGLGRGSPKSIKIIPEIRGKYNGEGFPKSGTSACQIFQEPGLNSPLSISLIEEETLSGFLVQRERERERDGGREAVSRARPASDNLTGVSRQLLKAQYLAVVLFLTATNE